MLNKKQELKLFFSYSQNTAAYWFGWYDGVLGPGGGFF